METTVQKGLRLKRPNTHARTHARAGKYDGEEAAAAEGGAGWGKEVWK